MKIYDVLYSMNTRNATPKARPFDNLLGQALGGEGVITTATGNPVSIITNEVQNAISTILSYSPKQSGSGDPSPQNIRPIDLWTEANLGVNSETPTLTESLGGTYYGFEIDVEMGVLRVTHAIVDLGALSWNVLGSGRHTANIADAKIISNEQTANAICTQYKVTYASGISSINYGFAIGLNNRSDIIINDIDLNGTSGADFQTAMDGVMCVYELDTPLELPLTPQTVALLAGNNTLWTDGDSLSVTYKARG